MDGRDQFFEPLKSSLPKYLLTLTAGLQWNKTHPLRFLGEWLSAPLWAIRRALSGH
jgi:hypothetical protein